jgi:hypothetical protein
MYFNPGAGRNGTSLKWGTDFDSNNNINSENGSAMLLAELRLMSPNHAFGRNREFSLSLLFYYTPPGVIPHSWWVFTSVFKINFWTFSEIAPAFVNALYDYSWILNWSTSKSLKYFSHFIMSRFFRCHEKKTSKNFKIFLFVAYLHIHINIINNNTQKTRGITRIIYLKSIY